MYENPTQLLQPSQEAMHGETALLVAGANEHGVLPSDANAAYPQ